MFILSIFQIYNRTRQSFTWNAQIPSIGFRPGFIGNRGYFGVPGFVGGPGIFGWGGIYGNPMRGINPWYSYQPWVGDFFTAYGSGVNLGYLRGATWGVMVNGGPFGAPWGIPSEESVKLMDFSTKRTTIVYKGAYGLPIQCCSDGEYTSRALQFEDVQSSSLFSGVNGLWKCNGENCGANIKEEAEKVTTETTTNDTNNWNNYDRYGNYKIDDATDTTKNTTKKVTETEIFDDDWI